MVLPVFGPPRVGPLGAWSPSRLVSYKSQEIHYRIISWHWIFWLLQEFNPLLVIVGVDTTSSGMAKVLSCNAAKSVQKVGTILPLSYHALWQHWQCTSRSLYASKSKKEPNGRLFEWRNIHQLHGNRVVQGIQTTFQMYDDFRFISQKQKMCSQDAKWITEDYRKSTRKVYFQNKM